MTDLNRVLPDDAQCIKLVTDLYMVLSDDRALVTGLNKALLMIRVD